MQKILENYIEKVIVLETVQKKLRHQKNFTISKFKISRSDF